MGQRAARARNISTIQHRSKHTYSVRWAQPATISLSILALVLLWSIGVIGGVPTIHAAAANPGALTTTDPSPTLSIVYPAPGSDNVSQGPVGANVTIQGASFTPGQTLLIGFAPQNVGCANGYTAFSATYNVPVGQDGTFTDTFSWPTDQANALGTSYYLCAQDTMQQSGTPQTPPTQSAQVYTVLSKAKPKIVLSQPPATSATPNATPAPGQFYPGPTGMMQITGDNFLPGSTTLSAYVTTNPITTKSDLNDVAPLTTSAGSQQFTSDGNGRFTVVVTLPQESVDGPTTYYLYVLSDDGPGNGLPSLVANRQFQLIPPPTPTPTVAPTAIPTPTTSTPTTGAPPSGNGVNGAVIGLGFLSIVLFILGVILLASAATPRSPQNR